MTAHSIFSPIMRVQKYDIVSAPESIIETHASENLYYNYYKMILLKNTIRVHHTTETVSKLTVTSMNCQKAGFRQPYNTIYLTVLSWSNL